MWENLLQGQDAAGVKGREYYIENVLKNLQCVLYASKCEGHPSVPREVIYMGVPCLLPDRKWARAMFKDKYPFYYDSEKVLIAKVKQIMNGKVSNADVASFNACRHDKNCIELMEDTAEKFYQMAAVDVSEVHRKVCTLTHDRVLDTFLNGYSIGERFNWDTLARFYGRNGISVTSRPRVYNLTQIYKFLHNYITLIDPLKGIFERSK